MPRQIANRTIFTGDNLQILRGMNSAMFDLIYMDPPFNSNRNYSAPIGSKAAGAHFVDIWTSDMVKDAWLGEIAENNPAVAKFIDAAGMVGGGKNKAYLIAMAVRLLEMKRVLKPTGNIFLHCDPTMSHPLKMLMDCIFGRKNFCNEIIWSYRTGGASRKKFAQKHDVVLFFRGGPGAPFFPQKERAYTKSKSRKAGKVVYGPGREALFEEDEKGVYTKVFMRDVWDIPYINSQAKERTGFPTQKPLALMERVILAASGEGDWVLDPACGCATTCIAAEKLKRRWVGIDIAEKAVAQVRARMCDDLNYPVLFAGKIAARTDIPVRTDIGKLPKYSTHKQELYGKQGGYCNGCRMHFPPRNLTVDHRVPRKKGGQDNLENLQLLCGACNSRKGAGTMEELLAKLKKELALP